MNIAAAPMNVTASTVRDGAAACNGGLDALRASLTLLVVLHHTALTYGAIGGWFYREIAPSSTFSSLLLTLFCTINQAYFMGLFFLIAGYLTPGALERHGVARFVRERLLRLGLPLLVFGVLIGPATIALARTGWSRGFLGALYWQWRHGVFEPGPLWFCEALLIFTAAFLAVSVLYEGRGRSRVIEFPSNGALLLAAIITGAAAFLLRLKWPVGINIWALQLGYFASYVVLFAAGCLGAETRWLENLPASQVDLWRRIAWFALPVLPLVALAAPRILLLQGVAEGGWNAQAAIYAFWEPFVAWGIILALLVFFQRRFNTLNRFWQALSRRAYVIFIIHPPIVVGVALAWRDIQAPSLLKFAVTGLVTCILCFLAAGALLCLPGLRRVV